MTSRDFDPVQYNRYADECCQLILEAAEYPSDVYLVQVVKLLHLSEKIRNRLTQQDWDPPSGISAPVGACVKSLEAELLSLKPSVSADLPQNGKSWSEIEVCCANIASIVTRTLLRR